MRVAKQIIYGAFYLIILGGIVAAVYFFFLKPAPSCFDQKQNQNEEGIDCGGVCSNVCLPPGLKAPRVIDRVLVLHPTPERLTILGRISNPNQDYAIKNLTYEFLLYDLAGQIVQSFSGESFLYAGEVKYIVLPNISYPAESFSKIDLKISNYDWVLKKDFPGPPKIDISALETHDSGNSSVVEGRITNNDTVAFNKIFIVAILRGKLGQTAGVSQTEIDSILPNETKEFSIIHPKISDIDFAGTKVFVYTKRI